jgi:predicted nucleic acid-binding protein
MRVLLDTNICIAVMRGHERAVARLAAMSVLSFDEPAAKRAARVRAEG